MNNLQCRKAYVRVNLDVDEEGTIIPMLIRWKDGRVFQIEQLKYKCRASSNKVGGGGIRYTVMIRGKESFLFHEGNKWFVEAKEDKKTFDEQRVLPSFSCNVEAVLRNEEIYEADLWYKELSGDIE